MRVGTYDGFYLVAVLFDEFEGEQSDGDNSLRLDDETPVYLCEGALPQKVTLTVRVFSVFQRFHFKDKL